MDRFLLEKVETPRLWIRPVQEGDELELNQLIKASLASLERWLPWAKDPSLEATSNHVQTGVRARQLRMGNDLPMLMIEKASGKIIGGTGYNDRSNPDAGLYEIGYWIGETYRGKGYVTECVNALLRFSFEALGAKRVVVRAEVENVKSLAVLERLSFKHEDTLPSISTEGKMDHFYSRDNLEGLPELEVSWKELVFD